MWRQNHDASAAIREAALEPRNVTGQAGLERLERELAELERADELPSRRRDLRALIAEHRL